MMSLISWRKVGAPGGRHNLAGAVGVVLVSVLAAAAPALGDTRSRNLTIHTVGPALSETCLVGNPDGLCVDLQETLTVTSNLAGNGTLQLTLIRTVLDNGCFTAEESTTITFGAGTISTQTSFPAACAPPKGLLINEPFEVTSGTGAFAGATGGGHEFTAPGGPSPLIYIGTITF
jgi:hypothetical protein